MSQDPNQPGPSSPAAIDDPELDEAIIRPKTGIAVTSPSPIYYPELDGLRFFAFAAVYLFHRGVPEASGWINAPIRAAMDWAPALRRWLPANPGAAVLDNGWVGVQLFFILSGFLIATL